MGERAPHFRHIGNAVPDPVGPAVGGVSDDPGLGWRRD